MIREAALGIARLLFSAALLALILAALLGYASYRIVRKVGIGSAPAPTRQAAFAVLLALAALGRSLAEGKPK